MLKKETKKKQEITQEDINNLWHVIDEINKNLDFLNDKVERLMTRVGVE
tara:strand:- start:438 stop:584 length:147 start_codon:yes stop_codon:yes gene_type:complete